MITSNGIIFAITKIVVFLASKAAKSVIWRSWNRRKKKRKTDAIDTRYWSRNTFTESNTAKSVIALLEGKTENNSAG